MRTLFRATLALFCLGLLVSTSEAFWRHKDCKRPAAAEYDAPGVSCAGPSCGSPPGVAYVPETKDVYSTRYRAEVRYVPETVVTKVTTMVPVRVAPPPPPPGAGCHGTPPGLPPGAGCHGTPPGAGCHGTPPGAGCYGGPPGATWDRLGYSFGGDGFSPRLAQLETKLATLDAKISALTTAVADLNAGGKAPEKTALPIPPLPVPATPTGSAKPTVVGSAATPDADPLLAAARAFKAKQALAKDAPPLPAGDPLATSK